MRKVLFVAAFVVASVMGAKAQDNSGFHLAGGVKVALPIGTFGDFWSLGFGAEFQGEYMFAEQVSGVVSAGYTHFLGKDVNGFKAGAVGFIPIMGGVRFYPSGNVFIAGKAGVSIGTGNASGSSFTYEPQVGYNGEKFSVAAFYNGISSGGTLGSIGVTALIKFN